MTPRKKWQQLAVNVGADGSFAVVTDDSEIADEINDFRPTEDFTLDHLGWLGWELVTVCKSTYYYKRPMF